MLGIGSSQGFSLSNSLIKKLYSAEEQSDGEDGTDHKDLRTLNTQLKRKSTKRLSE